MAATPHVVCWTVHNASSVVTIDGKAALDFAPVVKTPTDFEFDDGDKSCAATDAGNFTIFIAPTNTDIQTVNISQAGAGRPGKTTFTDTYKTNDTYISLNMRLKATAGGVNDYTIDGGRPIIRNDPNRLPPYTWLVVGLALVLVAYLAYRWWRDRSRGRMRDEGGH
jgi:hypothetical protein